MKSAHMSAFDKVIELPMNEYNANKLIYTQNSYPWLDFQKWQFSIPLYL